MDGLSVWLSLPIVQLCGAALFICVVLLVIRKAVGGPPGADRKNGS